MKKNFLFFAIAFICIFFYSCLGDGKSTFQGSNEFVVVRSDTESYYTNYVWTKDGIPMTWSGIDEYSDGDALILTSYKIEISQGATILQADYATVLDENVYRKEKQVQLITGTADTVYNSVDYGTFRTLDAPRGYDWEFLYLDRYLLNYSLNVPEDAEYDLQFIYDASNQVTKNQTALPENTILVDVVLNKIGVEVVGDNKVRDVTQVIDVSRLRDVLSPTEYDNGVATYKIWFRYFKTINTSEGDRVEVTYYQNAAAISFEKES